jgi:hypothetical protein
MTKCMKEGETLENFMANPQSDHPSCRTGVDGVEVKRLQNR